MATEPCFAEGYTYFNPFVRIRTERPKIKLLRKPNSLSSSWVWSNLGYQMQWSVKVLEQELAAEGHPHVLQLNTFTSGTSGTAWQEPERFCLYADGIEVGEGTGEQARACFVQGAEVFKDLCREGIERAGLGELTEREYWLLCRARDVARFEPFDEARGVIGERYGRL